MSLADDVKAPIRHVDRFFIGGQWVQPSSDATIKVIDSGTEELFRAVLLGVVGRHRARHDHRRAAPHRRHLL